MNPRKDKILFNLWLTKEEVISLQESLKMLEGDMEEIGYAQDNIIDIIEELNKRKDIERR